MNKTKILEEANLYEALLDHLGINIERAKELRQISIDIWNTAKGAGGFLTEITNRSDTNDIEKSWMIWQTATILIGISIASDMSDATRDILTCYDPEFTKPEEKPEEKPE